MASDFYEKHLQTFPMERPLYGREDIPLFGSLPELFRTFEKTTGYQLAFIRSGGALALKDETQEVLAQLPIINSQKKRLGILRLWRNRNETFPVNDDSAIKLAQALANTIEESYNWAQALRDREAELASLTCRPFYRSENINSGDHLYEILKDGAQMIDCEASAFYLLDEETSQLKLHSAWGIPEERLTLPPRPLKGALADLEALLGNAVILNESYLTELWKAPEYFTSSICIPIVSRANVLGTLWFFSDVVRDFDKKDLSILQLISERLILELENISMRIVQKKVKDQAEEERMKR